METQTATAASSAAPVDRSVPLSVPTETSARREWLKTGNLPDSTLKPEKTAESATANGNGTDKGNSSTSSSKTAAASETATTQESKRNQSPSEIRLKELLADLKNAGLTPEELKTFKKQAAAAAQPGNETKTAESSTAKTETAAASEEPKEPVLADFKDYDEFDKAHRKWVRDFAKWTAQQAVAELQQGQAQAEQKRKFDELLEAGKKRYPDFEQVARPAAKQFLTDPNIVPAVKLAASNNDLALDLIYVLAGNADDFSAFLDTARKDPVAAIERIGELKALIREELKKSGTAKAGEAAKAGETVRDAKTGQFQKAPEKKVSDAPPPPHEVSSRTAPPADEVENAVKNDDFGSYKAAQNRRDLQRRKG